MHLVELDLLRGGPRLPVESLPARDYCVLISRYEDRPQVGLWPINVGDSLPVVPVPLSGADSAELDLQQAIHEVEAGPDCRSKACLPVTIVF